MLSVYQVTGRLGYRGHPPGAMFEAVLDPGAEKRALTRGNIRVVERSNPGLQPGSYRLPEGWDNQNREVQER